MNESEAISKMIPPGAKKPGKWMSGVIQIWLTRACDLSCFNCTQGSNLGGNPGMITLENFEKACISLKNYHGVVGVFGGNPAMHPKFEAICEILAIHIPFHRRGLWCNNPLGKGRKMREIFNPQYSNLNVHLSREAYDEFKRDWPECNPCGLTTDSRHSPVWAALQDMEDLDNGQRWELISKCDINRHWSGMFGQFRGALRFWFCEIAGAQAMLHQHEADYPDTGYGLGNDDQQVWDWGIEKYSGQIQFHCMGCGVPMRGYGELAQSKEGTEQVSFTHEKVFKPKNRERLVQLSTTTLDVKAQALGNMVSYLENSAK